jgi:transposase
MEMEILRRQGHSLRSIARETGVAVNTVRKYLAEGGPPRYGPRRWPGSKLDPFKDYLTQRLEQARPYWIPATVLAREIRAQGFAGCDRLVSRFTQTLKPAATDDPVVRFETQPGQQMQIDWIEFRRERLAAFVATLGFSRMSYVEYVHDERIETLIGCHINAFEFFGGLTRELLYDNVKTVVLERDGHGPGVHRFHPSLWDLAKHYGFQPRLCRPYRAKTKGKVERFNGYLRYSFHIPLLTRLRASALRLDRDTANVEVRRWLADVANARIHGTTGRVPAEVLHEEQPLLQPLPAPYRGRILARRALPAAGLPTEASRRAYAVVPPQHALGVYDRLLEVAS